MSDSEKGLVLHLFYIPGAILYFEISGN